MEIHKSTAAGDRSVAIIVNIGVNGNAHYHLLNDALESSLQQRVPAAEILVIDHGSNDNAQSLAAKFPGVQYHRYENAGRFGAQNYVLAEIFSRFVVFLDMDERLTPVAIEAGLDCFEKNPDAILVCGGHRVIDKERRPASPVFREQIDPLSWPALSHGCDVRMKAAVMYRTDWLRSVVYPVNRLSDAASERNSELTVGVRFASHDSCVAEYQYDKPLMFARSIVEKQLKDDLEREVDSASRPNEKLLFHNNAPQIFARAAHALVKNGWNMESARIMANAAKMAPLALMRVVISRCVKAFMRGLPRSFGKIFGEALWSPKVGTVRFGDFGRTKPVSNDYGFDRGTPVDRYYIERVLKDHAELVRGRVLEVSEPGYTRMFGAEKVVRSDVLDIDPANPMATIIGDLGVIGSLPEGAFDCIVLTQTLQLIYNLDNAMENLHRALVPGGVLLVTVPGISPIGPLEIRYWYWAFTELSLYSLLNGRFGESNVQVDSYGNVFAAICFLTGLSLAEIDAKKLDYKDKSYPVTVFACARKPS
jgi:hypothetical protein